MKRSDFINNVLAPILAGFHSDPHHRSAFTEARYVLDVIEQAGMLPPLSEAKLVPDHLRSGTKHSEVKREWEAEDEETE